MTFVMDVKWVSSPLSIIILMLTTDNDTCIAYSLTGWVRSEVPIRLKIIWSLWYAYCVSSWKIIWRSISSSSVASLVVKALDSQLRRCIPGATLIIESDEEHLWDWVQTNSFLFEVPVLWGKPESAVLSPGNSLPHSITSHVNQKRLWTLHQIKIPQNQPFDQWFGIIWPIRDQSRPQKEWQTRAWFRGKKNWSSCMEFPRCRRLLCSLNMINIAEHVCVVIRSLPGQLLVCIWSNMILWNAWTSVSEFHDNLEEKVKEEMGKRFWTFGWRCNVTV